MSYWKYISFFTEPSSAIIYLFLTPPALSTCRSPWEGQQVAATIVFSASGIDIDVHPDAVVLIVDNVSYSFSDLPKSFNWTTGSIHVFEWMEVVLSTIGGKRYAWNSTSGISFERTNFIAVPVNGGSISAEYKTQYLWIISAEGLGSDAVGRVVVID